jgi:hypothetical protein
MAIFRRPLLAAVGLAVAVLFAFNVASLADETGPAYWAGAIAAALAGAGAFVVLLWRPPALVERLTGARRGLLPLAAAGIAVLVVGSAPPEAQLVALSFLAGLLGAAIASSALRRAR